MTIQTDPYSSLMRFYEAEARYSASGLAADRTTLLATLHRDIVLHQPESLPYGGQWKGRDEFARWLEAFVGAWNHIVPTDPVFYTCGDDVLVATVVMRATSKASGSLIEMPMCQVIRFSDGLPIEWRNFAWDTATMLNALRIPAGRAVAYEDTG
jgi:uncharacterized protein